MPNDMQNKNLIFLLSELTVYLRDKGYIVSDAMMDTVIKVAAENDIHEESQLEALLRPLVVKDASEDYAFHDVFHSFFHPVLTVTPSEKKAAQKKLQQLTYQKDRKESIEERLKQNEKEQERLEKQHQKTKRDDSVPVPYVSDTILKRSGKLLKKSLPGLKATLKHTSDASAKAILSAPQILSDEQKISLDDLSSAMSAIPDLMKSCMRQKQWKEILDFLEDTYRQFSVVQKKAEIRYAEMIRYEQNRKGLQSEKETLRNQLIILSSGMTEDTEQEIVKLKSLVNRPVFDPETAHRSVHAYLTDMPKEMHKPFNTLSKQEKEKVKDYIQDNMMNFRTRMMRKIRTKQNIRIDMKDTIKHAMRTGGVPAVLSYKKPKRNKTKIIMFLDISGSCRAQSELMLFFMYSMQDIFPSGIRSYVFVNSLYDVTDIFEAEDADRAVKEVFKRVPTKGVYSDYGVPFKEFYKNDMDKLTKDSIVFVIGDARNNRNESGEDYVKAIARRGKAAFFLETDDKRKWNQGDSIIRTYMPYMRKTEEVKTPAELLHFIENFSV